MAHRSRWAFLLSGDKMKIAVDLHSHSGHAGGVGNIPFESICRTMQIKGIDIFGTGDCMHPERFNELKDVFIEAEPGLFKFKDYDKRFILQTEVILTVQLEGYKNRTIAHHVILFPDFNSIRELQILMDVWGMKNTIGRPFIKCEDQAQLQERLYQIQNIHPLIEVIPAHVMTPDGIMGSKNGLNNIREFYGDFTDSIRVIETGLSADPDMLGGIPDFAELTMISNSDCHSAALNRIGREFTMLNVIEKSYEGVINALRGGYVEFTAEFHPSEGRYFLTGHRASRHDSDEFVYLEDKNDSGIECPVCGKKMLKGVLQRCEELTDKSIAKRDRKFYHLVPLIEAVALGSGVKTLTSSRVTKPFDIITTIFVTEIDLWMADEERIQSELNGKVKSEIINTIIQIKRGNFEFSPPGHDGAYGKLTLKK